MYNNYCCGPDARQERFLEKIGNIVLHASGEVPSEAIVDKAVKFVRAADHTPKTSVLDDGSIRMEWELKHDTLVLSVSEAGETMSLSNTSGWISPVTPEKLVEVLTFQKSRTLV